MDNLFGMIRRNKIFDQTAQPDNPYQVTIPDTASHSSPVVNPFDNSTPMMDLYKQSLEAMPNRDDYKPTTKNKIGAALSGFSEGLRGGNAYKATTSALDEPYNEAEDEWTKRIGKTGELASLEERSNAAKNKNIYDYAKLNDDEANSASLRNYRGKQGAKLDAEIPLLGRTTTHNKVNGMDEIHDSTGKLVYSNQADLTPGQKSANELGLYTDKGKIGLKNDETLAAYKGGIERQTHQDNEKFDVIDPTVVKGKQDMESFKNDLAQSNIQLRSSLQGMNPTQQNAALSNAIEKTLIDTPEYSKFKDANGNITNAKGDPDYEGFKAAIAGNLSTIMGKNKNLETPKGNPLSSKGTQPTAKVVSDDEATAKLRSMNKVVNADTIAAAKQLIMDGK